MFLYIIYLGKELSEAKLYVIKTKVDTPPEMLFIGMLIASQTHTLISSKKIPPNKVTTIPTSLPAMKSAIKGLRPNLSLKLPM